MRNPQWNLYMGELQRGSKEMRRIVDEIGVNSSVPMTTVKLTAQSSRFHIRAAGFKTRLIMAHKKEGSFTKR
jgi:hypothetical protein